MSLLRFQVLTSGVLDSCWAKRDDAIKRVRILRQSRPEEHHETWDSQERKTIDDHDDQAINQKG